MVGWWGVRGIQDVDEFVKVVNKLTNSTIRFRIWILDIVGLGGISEDMGGVRGGVVMWPWLI